jgi:hypothetical protein
MENDGGPWNDNDGGKPKNSENSCPNATLSTTNPTYEYIDLKSHITLRLFQLGCMYPVVSKETGMLIYKDATVVLESPTSAFAWKDCVISCQDRRHAGQDADSVAPKEKPNIV